MQNINAKIFSLRSLILVSFLIRIVAVYFTRDLEIANEWNILVENLLNHKSYSYYNFNNQLIPSVYMPPLYAFFIYFLKIIFPLNSFNFLYLLIFFQIIFSTYAVYLFFKINTNFFSAKLSLINSGIFSLIPLNLYACGQISSITLQIFLTLLFINSLILVTKPFENK